jgi:two-component system OmpR family sensor kinase
MTIKARIWIFVFVVVAAMVAMAAVTALSIRTANENLAKSALSRLQLQASIELAMHANRFSEQIAEVLLLGESEREDFVDARGQTSASILNLLSLSRQEIGIADTPEDLRREELQYARVTEMGRLFRQIDRAAERVLLLDTQGSGDEAITVFKAEIENQLDANFQSLVAAAIAEENTEVTTADAKAQRVMRMLVYGLTVLAASLVVISLGAGYLFSRSLVRPLNAIADGARQIERGNLDHRITYLNRNEFGRVAGRFNAMVDEVQRQRQELVDARNNLEAIVSERTGELDEAVRQLQALDRRRVSFLADISHELKTPLTALRGEAEVTLRGASKSLVAYREAMARIVAYSSEMGHLIDDLLFLARSEVDDVRFDFRSVDLAPLIFEAVQEAGNLTRGRNIEILNGGNGQIPVVRADPRRLKQALLAVLDNAVKYAGPDGQVRVDVGAVNGSGLVRVQNSGTVIAPEDLPYVFERFYRGGNATGSGNDGNGLGLSVARWIVRKHEGTIEMSSSPEAGTELRIMLPCVS